MISMRAECLFRNLQISPAAPGRLLHIAAWVKAPTTGVAPLLAQVDEPLFFGGGPLHTVLGFHLHFFEFGPVILNFFCGFGELGLAGVVEQRLWAFG